MEFRRLALDELDLALGRLRRLPEPEVRRMAVSLQSKGQLSPLVAADLNERLLLIDGFVRVLAAKTLGLDQMTTEVVQVSAAQMKAQVYLRNRERGLHLMEECRLVRELSEVDGLSQVEVADILERHKSWVCRRLALGRRLSPALLGEVDLGRLAGGSLCRLAQLPARNQEQVWALAQQHALASHDVGLLADLWRRAPDPDARAWVLAHPTEAVKRARGKVQPALDARLGPAGERVARALASLRRVSLQLSRHVEQGLGALPSEGLEALRSARRQAQQDSSEALKRLQAALEGQDD